MIFQSLVLAFRSMVQILNRALPRNGTRVAGLVKAKSSVGQVTYDACSLHDMVNCVVRSWAAGALQRADLLEGQA